MTTACLLLLPTLPETSQEREAMRYSTRHGLVIVSLARDPRSALTVVTNHVAEVVLAAVEPVDEWLAELIGRVTVLFARRRQGAIQQAHDDRVALIAGALARTGNDYRLVAHVLGLPESTIRNLTRREA